MSKTLEETRDFLAAHRDRIFELHTGLAQAGADAAMFMLKGGHAHVDNSLMREYLVEIAGNSYGALGVAVKLRRVLDAAGVPNPGCAPDKVLDATEVGT